MFLLPKLPAVVLSMLLLGLLSLTQTWAQDAGTDEAKSVEITDGGAGPARGMLNDFSSDLESLQLRFTQVVKSQGGRIQDQTGGYASLRNPDMLYWVYEGDFPEIIVADGNSVWIYDEALEQVTVRPQSASVSDTPLLILTDISKLDDQFNVAELGEIDDMLLLELRSRSAESEFERILIGLDCDGIKMMVMEDAYGQRTEIQFSELVKNAEIDESLFNFIPPEGVDVVGELPQPQ